MAYHIPHLTALIEQANDSADDSEGILYQFLSAHRRPYDITGSENQALALLINFSVKRSAVHNPLSMVVAKSQLKDDNCKLVKRYYQSIKGIHTHNIKFPLSFLRGNIRHEYFYNADDPYVHPGSVQPSKRWGNSQNAEYIKSAKALYSEFYFEGKLTSVFEEIRNHSSLGEQFIELLIDAVDSSWKAKNEGDERPDELVHAGILQMKMHAYPNFATDPQIYSLRTSDNESPILLSPVVNSSLQRELYIRLQQDSPPWLKAACLVGTGLDKNTYGDLISDTGGFLRVLSSKPPKELKSKFGLLIERLNTIGHLYRFDQITPDFLYFFSNQKDTETGLLKRVTTYRQNQVIKKECYSIVCSIFRDYRSLNYFRKKGESIHGEDENYPAYSRAQAYILARNTRRKVAFQTIIDELIPLLEERIVLLTAKVDLPYTLHHQQVISDAIRDYLSEI